VIYFDALTETDCEQIRKWRNEDISAARTPFLLTEAMQRDFYRDVVSNRDSVHRYWAVRADASQVVNDMTGAKYMKLSHLAGIAGLTNIEWENGRAEVALMIGRDYRGNGYGIEAFNEIKKWAFERMRLHTIYACVYGNNPDIVDWWLHRDPFHATNYPAGKFWKGEFWSTHHMTWVNE